MREAGACLDYGQNRGQKPGESAQVTIWLAVMRICPEDGRVSENRTGREEVAGPSFIGLCSRELLMHPGSPVLASGSASILTEARARERSRPEGGAVNAAN